MKKALAFDIGGTKIYSTIIDENGNIIEEIEKFSTPKTIDGIKKVLKKQVMSLPIEPAMTNVSLMYSHTSTS